MPWGLLIYAVLTAIAIVQAEREEKGLEDERFCMISFVSENIASYGSLITSTHRAYAQVHGIPIRIFTSTDANVDGLDDLRWAKVPLLLRTLSSWRSNCSHVVFVDADLIVLNTRLDLYDVVRSNPTADIIMAEDSLDFANSGFIIARTSTWASTFLAKWWSLRNEPGVFCDQHALNAVSFYLRNIRQLQHVAVVPPCTMNSLWPALVNFNEEYDVLHLMGEYNEVREAIAQLIIGKLPALVEPFRLTVTKAELLVLKERTLLALIHRARRTQVWSEAVDVLRHYCDWKPVECREALHDVDQVLGAAQALEADLISRRPSPEDFSLLDHSVKLKLLILSTCVDLSECVSAAQQIQDMLELFTAHMSDARSNRIYVHGLRAQLFTRLAVQFQLHRQSLRAVDALLVAAGEQEAAMQVLLQTASVEFQSLMLEYIGIAEQLIGIYVEQSRLAEAREWCTVAFENGQALRRANQLESRLIVTTMNRVAQGCNSLIRIESAALPDTQYFVRA